MPVPDDVEITIDRRRFAGVHEDDFVVSSSTIGKKLSPEHQAILARVRRQQLEQALKRSAERRRKWGLPELGYRPPTA